MLLEVKKKEQEACNYDLLETEIYPYYVEVMEKNIPNFRRGRSLLERNFGAVSSN